MRRPFRPLFVSPWTIALFAAIYFGQDAIYGFVRWRSDVTLDVSAMLRRTHETVIVLAAALYGFTRAVRFHPLANRRYAGWLRQSPWTSRQPLPLGPIHLVLRDVVPVGGLMALAQFHAGQHPALPAAVFLFTYLLGACGLLVAGEVAAAGAAGAALSFGLPLMLVLWPNPWWAAAAGAGLYGIAYVGIRQWMAAFPWSEPVPEGRKREATARAAAAAAGWPFNRVGPNPPPEAVSAGTGWGIAALVGWWLYAVCLRARMPPTDPELRSYYFPTVYLACAAGGIGVAFIRTLRYVGGYGPPTSLLGRLFTGRFIIPGYDHVFLAPLCATAAACAAPPLLYAIGLDLPTILAVTITLTLAAAINLGPALASWQLTGTHDMSRRPPGTANGRATPSATSAG